MDLSLSTSAIAGCPVLSVGGEVDVLSAPALRDGISQLLGASSPRLVIDLSEVAFIDSTGLGVLVAGRNQAIELGGTVALVCTAERVLKLFRITGLDAVFAIHPTVDEAVAAGGMAS